MSEIGVVHLIRAKNGIEPLKSFLRSYAANPAGVEHDLLIVYKGFAREKRAAEYEWLLHNFSHRSIFVKDFGFDIRPYFIVAKKFNYRYFCFLNSYSIIMDKDWLLKMHRFVSQEGVGIVGATGSYQSIYSDFINFTHAKKRPKWKKIILFFLSAWYLKILKKFFDPFPNYHIRTNAFMISRDLMCNINYNKIVWKFDTYRFESGTNSLTKQILKMNLDVLVVGKDGNGYKREEWHASDTFWQKRQANLLIADKQTMLYANHNMSGKMNLSRHAWGDKADPR
jgi:hypothetical protein